MSVKSDDDKQLFWLTRSFKLAVKNVPILKYSWVLIATICILALVSYFRLQNADVFFYAILVLFISFLGFVFSYLLTKSDKVVRSSLYVIIICIAITIGTTVISFGTYIIWGVPSLYNKLFPADAVPKEKNSDSLSKRDIDFLITGKDSVTRDTNSKPFSEEEVKSNNNINQTGNDNNIQIGNDNVNK